MKDHYLVMDNVPINKSTDIIKSSLKEKNMGFPICCLCTPIPIPFSPR